MNYGLFSTTYTNMETEQTSSAYGKLILWMKILLSLVALGYLSTQVNWADFVEHLHRLSILEISIFLCMAVGVLALGAKRWQAISGMMGHHLPFGYLFQANLVGHTFSQCLPSSVGGDFYRILAARQGGMPTSIAVLSTLADRLFGFFGLGLCVLLLLPFEWSHLASSFLLWPILMVLGGAIGLAVALVVLPYFPEKLFDQPGIRSLKPLITLSGSLRNRSYLASVLIFTFLTSFGLIGELYYLSLALDLNLSLTLMFATMPLVFMFMSLPISFAGWGLREGAMIVILGVYGVSREDALILSLIFGVLILTTALPGLIIWFWRLRRVAQPI